MSTDAETESIVPLRTAEIRAALREKYPLPEYALYFEVADATGARAGRSADAIAMSCWPSRGLDLMGFEIKASRQDWLKELRDPAKAEAICRYCDRWYLVIGQKGIVRPGELPPTWGLIAPRGKKLVVVTEAPKLTPQPVDREFLAALLRKAAGESPAEALLEAERRTARAEGLEAGRKQETGQLDREIARLRGDLERSKQTITEFERHSGVSLTYAWGKTPQIGEAVRFVMNGGLGTFEEKARQAELLGRQLLSTVEQYRKLREEPKAAEPAGKD